jgi:hypothetical protein
MLECGSLCLAVPMLTQVRLRWRLPQLQGDKRALMKAVSGSFWSVCVFECLDEALKFDFLFAAARLLARVREVSRNVSSIPAGDSFVDADLPREHQ